MDNATLHILLTCLLGIVTGTVSFLIKGLLKRVEALEKGLTEHQIDDSRQFAELHAHKDEVLRRLDSMDAKLDRLLLEKK